VFAWIDCTSGHCLALALLCLALAFVGRVGVSRLLVACLASLHLFSLIKRKKERKRVSRCSLGWLVPCAEWFKLACLELF